MRNTSSHEDHAGPDAGPGVLSRARQKFARSSELSVSDWISLGVATLALLRARIILARVSIRGMIKALEEGQSAQNDTPLTTHQMNWLSQMSWALQSAASHLPWRTDCLVRVIAADWLLRRKGLQPEFHLGAGKDDNGIFMAHAWLRCRGIEVTGGASPQLGTLLEPGRTSANHGHALMDEPGDTGHTSLEAVRHTRPNRNACPRG